MCGLKTEHRVFIVLRQDKLQVLVLPDKRQNAVTTVLHGLWSGSTMDRLNQNIIEIYQIINSNIDLLFLSLLFDIVIIISRYIGLVLVLVQVHRTDVSMYTSVFYV